MKQEILIAIALFSLMGMIFAPAKILASSNGDEENGNGEEETQTDQVQVSVQRGDNDTEEINVTPNVTVIVDFNTTLVTNETVTVGPLPVLNDTNGGNETGAGQNDTEVPPVLVPGNQTEPPTGDNQTETPVEETPNGTIPEPEPTPGNETTTPPAGNETTEPPIVTPPDGNETGTGENQTEVPTPIPEPTPGNETGGNETTEPIPLPPTNETAPPQGNETTPLPPTNDTEVPPIVVVPLPNGTIPVDNGTTVPVEPPVTQPTQINLALIESIQRGHIQHITAFVTDDGGAEFTDEKVNIQIINARNNILHNVLVTSGQEFAFKVGPNTSPQDIKVYAVLDSDNNVKELSSYNVFPKPPMPVTEIEPIPEPMPPVFNTTAWATGPGSAVINANIMTNQAGLESQLIQ